MPDGIAKGALDGIDSEDELRFGLWNEEGDRVWLPYELYESAGKARYAAWAGKGDLPYGLRECDVGLTDLKVSRIFACPNGSDPFDEWPWKICAHNAPGARPFWEITADA